MRPRLARLASLATIGLLFTLGALAQKAASIGDIAGHAVSLSQLTLSGNAPFHLKAAIVESTNPDSDYKADVEEYWISQKKWRRTIKSPNFSQTLVVNGDEISEQDIGDYYPFWLHNLVTALFDPLPMFNQLKQSIGKMRAPSGGEQSTTCARFQSAAGQPPAQISEFSVFCFEGSRGLLSSVVTPGYDADLKDYKPFRDKIVARRIVTDPEPGTTIEARVTDLTELSSPDEGLFDIQQRTPQKDRIGFIRVGESVLLGDSVNTPEIVWPLVRDGKTSGVLSMYVSVDRRGYVREAWPLNSDNARLDDSARAQVLKWQFKPTVLHDTPLQEESVLTFAFSTKIGEAIPVLSDAEARKLATNVVEAVVPQGAAPSGTVFTARVSVGTDGKVEGVDNVNKLSNALFLAAYRALVQWHFQPYLLNSKPDEFKADIAFRVP